MTDAAHEAAEDPLVAQARGGSVSLGQATMTGLRQPIVAILLLIALFTTITGKPLDGFLMLTVALLLVWDAARSRLSEAATARAVQLRQAGVGNAHRASVVQVTAEPRTAGYTAVSAFTSNTGYTADAPQLSTGADSASASAEPGRRIRWRWRALLVALGWLTAGLVYAAVVGAFKRYSWPATFFVVALGCLMVAVGWQGPLRKRKALTGRPLRRVWLWAAVLVIGGLWELSSLLQQPHLTTDSYAHPTISALTDPLLASHPGRSVALGIWLAIGWFLVGR